jgi:hypothetical protein
MGLANTYNKSGDFACRDMQAKVFQNRDIGPGRITEADFPKANHSIGLDRPLSRFFKRVDVRFPVNHAEELSGCRGSPRKHDELRTK